MVEAAAFLFETVTALIGRVLSFRQAPITSVASILVIFLLFWALAITWADPGSALYTWIAGPVRVIKAAGLHPGIAFLAVLVAAIPAYALWPARKTGGQFQDDKN